MRWVAGLAAYVACILSFLAPAETAPELSFPVNSQVPPVAYVDKAYSYTFSPTTFQSTAPPISYSIVDGPAWLSLESDARLLKGTPTEDDVGARTFQLTATDSNGETSSTVTLVILNAQNVQLGKPILPDLSAAGPVSAPARLLLNPLEPFSLSFSSDIFSDTSAQTTFYATSADKSPLPSWIQFDSSALSFSGISPTLVSPTATQQTFEFHLIATSVVGFSEATVSFQIALSYHILAFFSTSRSVSVQNGQPLPALSFRQTLSLDGNTVRDQDLLSVSANVPSWVTFDRQQISLSGTPPQDFDTITIPILAEDIYSDTANLSIVLTSVAGSQGADDCVALSAYIGKLFTYTLSSSMSDTRSGSIHVDLANASSWLTFSSSTLTLHGLVPANLTPQTLNISFETQNGAGLLTSKICLHLLQVQAASKTRSTTLQGSPTGQSPAQTPIPGNNGQLPVDTRPSRRLIVIIILSITLPVVAIMLLACFYSWRRHKKREKARNNPAEVGTDEATTVILSPAIVDLVDVPLVEEASRLPTARGSTPKKALRVELPGAPDSLQKSKERLSRRLHLQRYGSFGSILDQVVVPRDESEGDGHKEVTMVGSGNAELKDVPTPPPLRIHASKRPSVTPTLSKRNPQHRGSASLRPTSTRNLGLPSRASGAGHGGGILSVDPGAHRSSWQTTMGTLPVETKRDTVNLDSFPSPPSHEKENTETDSVDVTSRPTLRIVASDSDQSESMEVQRQKWHTERARDRLEGNARFSNAGSSRTPSLSRLLANTARSPSRTISPGIPEDAAVESPINYGSWCRWAGTAPVMRQGSVLSIKVGGGGSHPSQYYKDTSVASSGQFDSALSSDSQWEDQSLRGDEDHGGTLQQQPDRKRNSNSNSEITSGPPPHLSLLSGSRQVEHEKQGIGPGRPRLDDQRKRASVEDSGLSRAQRSHRASFRFI